MSDPKPTPWTQSTAGVVVVQGLLGPVVGAVVGVLVTLAATRSADVDWLTLAVVAGAVGGVVFLPISLFARGLRLLVWGNAANFLLWLSRIRLLSEKQREALEQKGHDKRTKEFEQQRAHSMRPRWRISSRNDPHEYTLHNSGYGVRDVHVTADPRSFTMLNGDVFFQGPFGDDRQGGEEGKTFDGTPTQSGLDEGVTFGVAWVDRNGHKHQDETFFAPEEIARGRDEALQRAHLRGRDEGRRESLAEQQAGPPVPLPLPRWRVYFGTFSNDESTNLILENSVPRSVAREVRVDATHGWFEFTSAAQWPTLSGEQRADFSGIMSNDAEMYGLTLTITWYDERAQQHEANYQIPPLRPVHPF